MSNKKYLHMNPSEAADALEKRDVRIAELETLVSVHIEEPVPDTDPIRQIGERLAGLLLADEFNWLEPKLNGIRKRITELEGEVKSLQELLDMYGPNATS